MLSCIKDQECHAARPRGDLPRADQRSSWLWKGALPTRVNGETHCSGAALFLTGTCQVSACTYVHMLRAHRITPVLWIKKELYKPGLQHTHNMHLVCTVWGKGWYCHTVSDTVLWLQLSHQRRKNLRTKKKKY